MQKLVCVGNASAPHIPAFAFRLIPVKCTTKGNCLSNKTLLRIVDRMIVDDAFFSMHKLLTRHTTMEMQDHSAALLPYISVSGIIVSLTEQNNGNNNGVYY